MLSVLLSVALAAAAPDGAATGATVTTAGPASATAAAPAAEEKKICKKIEASQSRLAAKRVCKTAEDWKLDQNGMQRVKKD